MSSHLNEVKKGDGYLLRTYAVIGRSEGADQKFVLTKKQMQAALHGLDRSLKSNFKWYRDPKNARSASAAWVDWSKTFEEPEREPFSSRIPMELFSGLKKNEKESPHPIYLMFALKQSNKVSSEQAELMAKMCTVDFWISGLLNQSPQSPLISEENFSDVDLEEQFQIDLIRELDVFGPDTLIKILKRKSVTKTWIEGSKPWPKAQKTEAYLRPWLSAWLRAIENTPFVMSDAKVSHLESEDLEKIAEGLVVLARPTDRKAAAAYLLTQLDERNQKNAGAFQKLKLLEDILAR